MDMRNGRSLVKKRTISTQLGEMKIKTPLTGKGQWGWCDVEPQRIELWSREDNAVLSTCLVDFNFREQQANQQPKLLLSH